MSFCSESIILSSDDEGAGQQMWVHNDVYSLTHSDQELIASPSGWLNDSIIFSSAEGHAPAVSPNEGPRTSSSSGRVEL